jgi:hypothetical protein
MLRTYRIACLFVLSSAFLPWAVLAAAAPPVAVGGWGNVTNNVGGPKWGADGVAVDFSDPQRKTLLLGLHEQSQSLQMSSDGGTTWQRIGDRLPALRRPHG